MKIPYLTSKKLANGEIAYYFNLPARLIPEGCAVKSQSLGKDYLAACQKALELYQQTVNFRKTGETPLNPKTIRYLWKEYKTTRFYKEIGYRMKAQYDRSYKFMEERKNAKGTSLADTPLDLFNYKSANKLYENFLQLTSIFDVQKHFAFLRRMYKFGIMEKIFPADFANPFARYSEVSFELGGDVVHGRLIEPYGRARASELVPLCLMFHDIDRPVRGWHHMTRFAAMGYAVLALDDEMIGSSDLQQGITSPAFVERVRWGCALAKVARNLDGMDPDRIFAWGEGLGGGVALAVSALDERGLACTAVANPLPGGLEALSSRVRGSVLMGTSLMDTVSDPKDQFAVFNGLECDRRHIIYAKYAHERINAFENEVVDFFNQTFYSCSLA